jgi:hypothetical protein
MSLVVRVLGVVGGGGHKSQTRNRLEVKVQRPVFWHNKQTWRRDNLTSLSLSLFVNPPNLIGIYM